MLTNLRVARSSSQDPENDGAWRCPFNYLLSLWYIRPLADLRTQTLISLSRMHTSGHLTPPEKVLRLSWWSSSFCFLDKTEEDLRQLTSTATLPHLLLSRSSKQLLHPNIQCTQLTTYAMYSTQTIQSNEEITALGPSRNDRRKKTTASLSSPSSAFLSFHRL